MRDFTARFPSLRAFRYPAYVRIWLGAFVSTLGSWVQTVSVGIWVTQTTGQAMWTGLIAAMAYAPAVVLGPIGGALADRYDRRRIIIPLSVVQALAVTALTVLSATGRLALPAIAALIFVGGCAAALAQPAFSALLSEIVEPEDLLSAVSLNSGQFNLARTLGPVLAAVALTQGGITLAFLANALSYFAVIAAVATATLRPRNRSHPAGGIWRGMVDGAAVARRDPGIRLALPLVLMLTVLIAPFIGLMPAFAIKGFGKDEVAASLLVMAQGAGALVAAFMTNALAMRWGAKNLLIRGMIVVGPIAAAYWASPWYGMAFPLLALLGGVYLFTMASLSTTCLGRVSRDLQARISSLYSVTLSGGYALGLFVQGWLQDRIGLRVVPVAAALLTLVVALWLRQRRAFDALEKPSEFGGLLGVKASTAPEA
ncbi:MAG: MFS transporter [Myxococcales bacterium]